MCVLASAVGIVILTTREAVTGYPAGHRCFCIERLVVGISFYLRTCRKCGVGATSPERLVLMTYC